MAGIPGSRIENVVLTPATGDQETAVANLLQFYLYDFSEMTGFKLGTNGRYGSRLLPRSWGNPGFYPFLILADSELAGFIFVKRGSVVSGDENIWDVNEFFVTRAYRRRGVGMRAAHQAWRMFPGKWEVRVIEQNPNAKMFWSRAIEQFIGREVHPRGVEINGNPSHVFSFESPAHEKQPDPIFE